MTTTDSSGLKWTDERLKRPKHISTVVDGFTLEIEERVGDKVGLWRWTARSATGDTFAGGFAPRESLAIEYAKDALALLKRSVTEV